MPGKRRCSCCGAETELGFLKDTVLPGGHLAPQRWVRGKPPVDGLYTASYANPSAHAVYALRCVKCGHIDLVVPESAA